MGEVCLTPSRVPAPITRQGPSDPRIDLTRGHGGTAAVTSTRVFPLRSHATRVFPHRSHVPALAVKRNDGAGPLWREGAPASPNETDQFMGAESVSGALISHSDRLGVGSRGPVVSEAGELKKQTNKQTRHSRKYTVQKSKVPESVLVKYPQLIEFDESTYSFNLTEKFKAAITEAETKAEAHRAANTNSN